MSIPSLERVKEANARAAAGDVCETNEDAINYYDQIWAKYYDEDTAVLEQIGYKIYTEAVEQINKYKDAKILDVAGGSGIFGKTLTENGLTNLYLLDASKEMIKRARSTGFYKEIYEEILQPNVPSAVVPDHSFDFAVALNCFYKAHLTPDGHIPGLLRMLKPGGKLIIGQGNDDGGVGGDCLKIWIDKMKTMGRSGELVEAKSFNYMFQPENEIWWSGMMYVIEAK